jgi:hypothetical protein
MNDSFIFRDMVMPSARVAHPNTSLVAPTPAAAARAATAAGPAARLAFIDNVRWAMIVLVLGMHAAVTYSPLGSWYYREHPKVGALDVLVFATFQGVLQGFFMALLFFVAGYFARGSYDAKGAGGFVAGRFYRLGLPSLLFMGLLGPITEYLANPPLRARPLGPEIADYLAGPILSGSGPLWFCLALLAFSLAYAAWRAARPAPVADAAPGRPPTALAVLATIAAMSLATWLVRLVQPLGSSVLNMQLCYFPSYIVMFALGLAARRGDWLRHVGDRFAFTAAGACVGVAMLAWLPMLALGGALKPDGFAAFQGGLTWQSAALATWEQLICVAMSFGVVAGFRRWGAGRGRFARFMSDNAFAVYVLHPPILVALAVAAAPVALPPLAKFVVLWAAGALVTFAVAAPLARRIPFVGRILQ